MLVNASIKVNKWDLNVKCYLIIYSSSCLSVWFSSVKHKRFEEHPFHWFQHMVCQATKWLKEQHWSIIVFYTVHINTHISLNMKGFKLKLNICGCCVLYTMYCLYYVQSRVFQFNHSPLAVCRRNTEV